MTTIALLLAVLFLAYSNGANDNFKGVASLFGCGAASYRRALAWATLTTAIGSIAALFVAQALLVKFSGKGLAPDTLLQAPPFMLATALGAGSTVILATCFGFPVSTTHALLGALTGASLMATHGVIQLNALLDNFVWPLMISPLLAMLLAAGVFFSFSRFKQNDWLSEAVCLCAENDALMITSAGEIVAEPLAASMAVSVGDHAACLKRNAFVVLRCNLGRVLDSLHFISAGAVCFARGLNDTPKIVALLLLAPGVKIHWVFILTTLMMALGGIFNARKVAQTMSHQITTMSYGQGLSANLTTAFLVIFASRWGVPVSTTHVSVGALLGIGVVNRFFHRRKVLSILLSWLLTLPCAALCAAAVYGLAVSYAA